MNKNLLKLTQSIAKDYLSGDESWKNQLDSVLKTEVEKTIDTEETTFESLVREIKRYANEVLAEYIRENIWEILSERELFDERNWENITQRFDSSMATHLTQTAENIADEIIDNVRDDIQYSKNKYRYFGLNQDDF